MENKQKEKLTEQRSHVLSQEQRLALIEAKVQRAEQHVKDLVEIARRMKR
jgi:hypothetical protein